MYKMIYMGSYNDAICRIVSGFSRINTIAFIVDESASNENKEKLRLFWRSQAVSESMIEDDVVSKVDFIFVCGFTKIIKSDLLEKYIFINIHAGDLPKWRGTSANSWAIINGENTIAYTLHRVTDVLDGGPIYRKFIYVLKKDEQYGDGRIALEGILSDELENTFCNICSGRNMPIEQSGKYVYCNSFRKNDGLIKDWNINAQQIVRLFKVLGYPYGSGVYFSYKEHLYEIMDLIEDDNYDTYECTPGAVVYKTQESVWIKVRDTVVRIKKLKMENGDIIRSSQLFQIGNRIYSDVRRIKGVIDIE